MPKKPVNTEISNDVVKNEVDFFAVSKIFSRAKKQMNLAEWKTFAFALSTINFAGEASNKIQLNKRELANAIGITADSRHLSQNLKRSIGDMPLHSYIQIDSEDKEFYESGVVVTGLRMYRNLVTITINPDYMGMFSKCSSDYILMLSNDIYEMTSDKSPEFYEDLRLHSDTRRTADNPNNRLYTTKQLKDIFGLKESDYMRAKGGFNRSAFETKVLDVVCEDIRKSKLINLILQTDSKGKCKYYEKVKKGGSVIGYRFYWTINNITRKKIETDSMNIPNTKNQFNRFPQRSYDYADLEKALLNK